MATVRNVGNFQECVLDYLENNAIADIEADIAALRDAAGQAGDFAQVELCDAATVDHIARRRCAEVIVEHADVV